MLQESAREQQVWSGPRLWWLVVSQSAAPRALGANAWIRIIMEGRDEMPAAAFGAAWGLHARPSIQLRSHLSTQDSGGG